MFRWWWVGWVFLAAPAWSAPPAPEGEPLPDSEISWILENSYVGSDGQRERLRLSFENPESERLIFPLDLPGIDLEWGRHLLEGDPEIGIIAPESVVGL